MDKDILLLEELSNAFGVSGFEDDVNVIVKRELGEDFEIFEDSMRNLVIRNKKIDKSKKVVMIDAHSDEIGFMVQSVNSNGTLNFIPIGSWPDANALGSKVIIKNKNMEMIEGIIGSIPPHFKESKKEVNIENMFIDVGAVSGEEIDSYFKIEMGDPVVPFSKFTYNSETQVMMGKAFDNRIGVGAVIKTMKHLTKYNLGVEIVGSISGQEEVGTRGVKVNVNKIKPDIAIVFEGSPADDTFLPLLKAQGVMKKGVQIRYRDNTMIANPRLITLAKEIANKENIIFQTTVRTGGGTNAGAIHNAGKAVASIVLAAPVRYAHSNYGICSIIDYENMISLAVELIKSMDSNVIKKL